MYMGAEGGTSSQMIKIYCLLVYTCKLYSHCLMYVEDHNCYMFMPSWGPNLEIKILYCIVL